MKKYITFEKSKMQMRLSGKIYRLNNHLSTPVKITFPTGKEETYKSISEAGRINNMDIANLNQAANGKYKFAYGCKVEFITH